MPTTRTHTAAQTGPVVFDVATVAAQVTVIVENRPAALITVSTPADSGPATDAVRSARFSEHPGGVSVRVQEPTGGMTANHSGAVAFGNHGSTIIQVAGTVTGVMVGAVFGDLNVVNGRVISGNAVTTSAASRAPISIEARLPVGSSLSCESTSGDVETDGALLDADVTTVSGDIRIDTVSLPRLRSTSGDIRVARFTGSRASAKTVSGDVRITAEQRGATVRARSVSGDIRVSGPEIDLDARTVSGRVTTR